MDEEQPAPRRSLRLALSETTINDNCQHSTPTKTSPDELIIVQRGPRKKPLTWSPFEPDTAEIGDGHDEKQRTPTRVQQRKSDIHPKLRRRLILSPSKNSSYLGNVIAKKLKIMKNIHQELLHDNLVKDKKTVKDCKLERET